MWKQYKKTFIPMQIVIFAISTWLYATGRVPFGGALVIFIAMQVAAALGAAWGARLRRKIESSNERLPLQ